jgi:hypothetical protein
MEEELKTRVRMSWSLLLAKKMQHVYLSLLLLVTIVGITLPTTTATNVFAQSQQQTQVFIVGSDGTTHEANLKAVKTDQLRKVSGFKIEAPNVVQIN